MTGASFLDGRVTLHSGDCLEVLSCIAECSIDSVVCDPPYHLTSIVKRFGAENAAPAKAGKTGAYKRASAGFMGKKWDGGDIAFTPELWAEVLRVLKPGGHLVAFSGTRTYHNMAAAIEMAGFEIRDQLAWVYGSGFPKSHNIGQGWGTALKPAWEPICLARKPLIGTIAANVLQHGTGAINIDGCRVDAGGDKLGGGMVSMGRPKVSEGWDRPWMHDPEVTERKKAEAAVKVAEAESRGRWPANIIHDGSEEVIAAFPETQSGLLQTHDQIRESENVAMSGKNYARSPRQDTYGDKGSAARFFYAAKADADDRIGSKHPTVKPVDLMQWLVRLVTPKGGLVLDPFAGTGTTGEAAWREGMRAVLIEREAEYQDDVRRRMKLCLAGQGEKRRESLKARGLVDDAGPLFGGQ